MHKFLSLAILVLAAIQVSNAQCTTTNGTSCACKDGSTDCDLLPDIIMANEPLEVAGNNGVIEYAQTGNGVENGRLRVSVSTPNIGHGPLTVRTSSIYLCGTDTFTSDPGTCPNGGSPRILCYQRVLHKAGASMSYYDRPAGSMTYHPTHNHMHVDDWGIYTLRNRDTAIADPLQWPVIGTGAKLGFCLMDYGTCSFYNGHCVDSANNTLQNADFPNYGLGGGNYNCDPHEQGISSGYVDIYYQYLEGMYLDIPQGTCNGEYYIVVQIDPHNYFLEENENNNVIAIPYVLTKQVAQGAGSVNVTTSLPETHICQGTALTLTAAQATNYMWTTGDTTQSITVTQPGEYQVTVSSNCGIGTSDTIRVTNIISQVSATTSLDGCQGVAQVAATVSGTAHWFSTPVGGEDSYAGSPYVPVVADVDTFYVESHDTVYGNSGYVGMVDNSILGGYYSNDQHQIFTVYEPIVLRSVKVYANSSKYRTVELRNSLGTVLQSKTVYVTQGTRTVALNFYIQPGAGYQLGWAVGSEPDLYRNSFGANYPYAFENKIIVTGNSSGDENRWYCYYNWLVEEAPVTCISPRVPVAVNITPAPLVTLTGLDSVYYISNAPIALEGTPPGGSFSGTGVTGSTFTPSVARVGGPYNISYQYTETATGCTGTATMPVMVLDTTTGIALPAPGSYIAIYPNPSDGNFTLAVNISTEERFDFFVINSLGQKVWEARPVVATANMHRQVNLKHLPSGIYTLIAAGPKLQSTYKIVIQ